MPNVLLVDDNESVRTLNKTILELGDYTVFTAQDGFQALDIFAKETIELIILDIDMPIMNGFEVLRTLQTEHTEADFAVIMLTASGLTSDRIEAKKMGVDDFIEKPIRSQQLLEVIAKVLQARK